jgi:hypothetical protein
MMGAGREGHEKTAQKDGDAGHKSADLLL